MSSYFAIMIHLVDNEFYPKQILLELGKFYYVQKKKF